MAWRLCYAYTWYWYTIYIYLSNYLYIYISYIIYHIIISCFCSLRVFRSCASQSFSMNHLSLTLIIPYAGFSPTGTSRFVQLTDLSTQITEVHLKCSAISYLSGQRTKSSRSFARSSRRAGARHTMGRGEARFLANGQNMAVLYWSQIIG